MSGINNIVNRGLDGLNVNLGALATTANNIANLNTPGYARQRIIVGTRTGGGAEILSIQAIVDPFIELQLQSTGTEFGTLDGRRVTVSQLESLFNESNSDGIGQLMTEFFSRWSELATDASSSTLRQSLKESSILLASTFNSISLRMNDTRTNLSSQIGTRLGTINNLASDIADLNEKIVTATDEGAKNDLTSRRTFLMRELAKEVDISYFELENGVVQIQVGGGTSLVNGFSASTLSLSDDLAYDGDATINITLAGTSTAFDITGQISGGRLGGNLIDRNTTLNTQIANFDALANQLVLSINALHTTGYGLDSSTGNNFFAPLASSQGAAQNITVDAGITADVSTIAAAGADPALTGVADNAMALNLSALKDSLTMIGASQTFAQYYQGIVGDVGVLAANVERNFNTQSNLLNQLEMQRENVSGVNMDEEGANLIMFQRAFQASSKLLVLADQLLETLLKI